MAEGWRFESAMAHRVCAVRQVARIRYPRRAAALIDQVGPIHRIALERCSSAREAVRLMGGLAEAHGFAGNTISLTGCAETLAVADSREAWVSEPWRTRTSSLLPWRTRTSSLLPWWTRTSSLLPWRTRTSSLLPWWTRTSSRLRLLLP